MTLLKNCDLYLAGSGVRSFLDLGLYTQKVLRESEAVFVLIGIKSLEDYLRQIVQNLVDLKEMFYHEGRHRGDIYRDISQYVVQEAKKKRPSTLLLHGHPLVFSTVSQLVLQLAAKEGLDVEVLPAVSSLDRIFVDLKLDIATRGIQILDAVAAMHRGVMLNPKIDCLLFQVGAPLGPIHEFRDTTPEDLLPLQEYLLRFYPTNQTVQVVESAVELGHESIVTPGKLGRLGDLAAAFNYTVSLYIPAE